MVITTLVASGDFAHDRYSKRKMFLKFEDSYHWHGFGEFEHSWSGMSIYIGAGGPSS
jgi:hypothetical protein